MLLYKRSNTAVNSSEDTEIQVISPDSDSSTDGRGEKTKIGEC